MPVSLGVDASGLRELQRDMKAANPVLAKSLRDRLKNAAGMVADTAKTNASWSSRIPGSIRTGATMKGAYVRAGGASAPHAAALEGAHGMTFRHPVYGHRQTWVSQQAHPYLMPALNSRLDDVAEEATNAINDWAKAARFNPS